jgi:hypothetical protein
MNAKITKLEYNVLIRVGSGDSCSVTLTNDRVSFGHVVMDLAEVPDFQAQIPEAIKAVQRINAKNPT